MKRVIMDVDPGVDDALAILLALRSNELEVLAITTVAGNTTLQNTTMNTLKILELIGYDVPVAMGEERSITGEELADTYTPVHGEDGLGGVKFPQPSLKPKQIPATSLIAETINSYKRDEISIIATGPLTNIARAIIADSQIAQRVNTIISMGGAFNTTPYGCGNYTPVAEFNIYRDPEAARIVYNSGAKVVAVGLDVTMNPSTFFTKELWSKLAKKTDRFSDFIINATRRSMDQLGFFALHDPIAVSVAIDPTLVKIKKYHVDVELKGELTRGETVADRRWWISKKYDKTNVNVCIDIDGRRFIKLFLKHILYAVT